MSTIQQKKRALWRRPGRPYIGFYENYEDYSDFSNVVPIGMSMNINGEGFKAKFVESFFQGVKGLSDDIPGTYLAPKKSPKKPYKECVSNAKEIIRYQGNSGASLRKRGQEELNFNQIYDSKLSDGSGLLVKEKLMEEILFCKATQHFAIAVLIIEAVRKNTFIVEEANDDPNWGWGTDGQGKNYLGKAWARVGKKL